MMLAKKAADTNTTGIACGRADDGFGHGGFS